jgi:hypothetical protein
VLLPSVKEGIEGVFMEKLEGLGVVGEAGFLKIGGGGGGMAFRSLSTSSCLEIFVEFSSTGFEGISSDKVVVILGVSAVFAGGASRFDSVCTREGEERWRNHCIKFHGGCL